MAGLSITSGSQPLASVRPTARADSIKAAQRAFFSAALDQTQATQSVQAATAPAPSLPKAPARQAASTNAAAPMPGRILRPGSIIDIRV